MRAHTMEDHLKTTSMLWMLVTVLLSVWMLGLYTSTTMGGFIHLLFGAAVGVLIALWVRRRPF